MGKLILIVTIPLSFAMGWFLGGIGKKVTGHDWYYVLGFFLGFILIWWLYFLNGGFNFIIRELL